MTDTIADVNGVARFVSALAHHAERNLMPLTVFACTHRRPACPSVRNIRPLLSLPIPRYRQLRPGLPHPWMLRRDLARFAPTIVHISTPGPAGFLARRWAVASGVPLAATYHTDFPAYVEHLFGHESLTAAAERYMSWFYSPMKLVLTRSDDYARRLTRIGIDPARIARLRPGIDLGLFHARGRGPRHPGRLRCLYVGRLSVEKNLPFLSSIWPRVRSSLAAAGITATLDIAGEGPFEKPMRALLPGQGVCFHGVLGGAALADLYRGGDLFLFPSTTDTLGQVVMEAQACGVPVIVSDRGGPREVVLRGRTGLVLAPSAREWIDAVVRLAADEPMRRSMSHEAERHMLTFGFSASVGDFWNRHLAACGRVGEVL